MSAQQKALMFSQCQRLASAISTGSLYLFAAGNCRNCTTAMLWLYRILFLPVLLVSLPYYLSRMLKRGGYRKRFADRFGRMRDVPAAKPGCKRVWIQAVSVGEVLAIRPLVEALRARPDIEVVVTTTTSTGLKTLGDTLGPALAWYGIFPIDFYPFVKAGWSHLQPDCLVLMEAEIWPEHLHRARKCGVPVTLVNGRLSDRSFRRHRAVRNWLRPLVRSIHSIGASSQSDLQRFQALQWLPAERITLTGNLKLDGVHSAVPTESKATLMGALGFAPPPAGQQPLLLLGASTWPCEEAALLAAFIALRSEFPQLRLLLVPRHAERRTELQRELSIDGQAPPFLSAGRPAPSSPAVIVADTTGELRAFTAAADLVVVGKSFPPNKGGQTPIEAAAFGKPLILGPEMGNFRDFSRQLIAANAAIQLESTAQLTAAIQGLLRDPTQRAQMGHAAQAVIARNQGATQRCIAQIEAALRMAS